MNSYIVVGVVILCSVTISLAQNVTFPGTCPAVVHLSNFSSTQYQGAWFEISKFNNSLVNDECGYSNYTWSKNQFIVTYTTRTLKNNLNISTPLVLKPQFNTPATAGRFDVFKNGNVKEHIPYSVVDTDYTNYSVVWGCTYSNGKNTQRLFVYSRRATLAREHLSKVQATLSKYKIDYNKQKNVVQDAKKCGRAKSITEYWTDFIALKY